MSSAVCPWGKVRNYFVHFFMQVEHEGLTHLKQSSKAVTSSQPPSKYSLMEQKNLTSTLLMHLIGISGSFSSTHSVLYYIHLVLVCMKKIVPASFPFLSMPLFGRWSQDCCVEYHPFSLHQTWSAQTWHKFSCLVFSSAGMANLCRPKRLKRGSLCPTSQGGKLRQRETEETWAKYGTGEKKREKNIESGHHFSSIKSLGEVSKRQKSSFHPSQQELGTYIMP